MDRDSSPDLLKQGTSRSVRLERGTPGQPGGERIVKRFHSREFLLPRSLGPLGLLDRDRRRAAREYRVLRALHEGGLAVPRPLALAAAPAGGWEVRMEYVSGAVPLIEVFLGASPWPAPPALLARQLGTLVAALHGAGLRHADLHAGNVLVGAGPPVAIDFHKARVLERPERGFPRAVARHLTQLVAGSREFVPPSFRTRFFTAWRRALPAELRARLPEPRVLIERVEASGRLQRREVVHDRRLRWTRPGSACRAVAHRDAFVAVDTPEGLFEELAGAGPGPRTLSNGAPVLIVAGEADAVRRGWYAAARMHEHRLPCGRPLAVALDGAPWFALELPREARPLAERDQSPWAALDSLAQAFEDRGVAPLGAGPEHLFLDRDGAALIAGVPGLTQARDAAARWLEDTVAQASARD